MTSKTIVNFNGHQIIVRTRRTVLGFASRVTDNRGNILKQAFSTLNEEIAQQSAYRKFVSEFC